MPVKTRECDMEIEISNCNNIDYGLVKIEEGVLNIKYAINGTGKSTVSKSIQKSVSSIGERGSSLPLTNS
jgi:hypothetical protein